MWENNSDSTYRKGYAKLMAHAKDFNCFQLQELEEMVDKNIAASPIANSPYAKGVKEGLRVMKVRLNMPEVVPIKIEPIVSEQVKPNMETMEKNSHIVKLIESVNMIWKRGRV